MSVFRSDDPAKDFERWDQEQQEWEDSLPKCDRCGAPQDAYVYVVDDQILCLGCMNKKYRRDAEDYVK